MARDSTRGRLLIDAHVHLLPHRLAEAIRAWFDRHAWNIRYRMDVDACVAELRAGGVDRAIALPYAHKPGMAASLNEFTLDLSRRHPEVLPCCTVFPGEDGAERILEEAFAGPFRGAKIHCHVMKIAPDDPRMEPVWLASARYRKPIVIHCGREPSCGGGYGFDVHEVSGAARLRAALEKHPDALAVVAHLGADEYSEFEALLDAHPGVYLDTTMAIAGYFPWQPDLELLRRRADRILYGTDFPNLPYEWTRELRIVRGLRLSASDEAKILGGNAARLFGT